MVHVLTNFEICFDMLFGDFVGLRTLKVFIYIYIIFVLVAIY